MSDQSMRPFTVLLIGQAISLFGSSLTGFALGIWAYEQVGSATIYTIIALANIVPVVLLSPLAGAVADRYNRKTIVLFAQLGAIAITAILTTLYWYKMLTPWHIIALVTLNSICNAFILPTISATIPLMVSKHKLTKANGMIALAFGLIELATPAIAGTLYGQGGMQTLFLLDLATFSIGIGALWITRIPQPQQQASYKAEHADDNEEEPMSLFASIAEGVRYLADQPALIVLVGFFSIMAGLLISAAIMVQPMLLGFAKPEHMGQIMSFAATGMILGAAVMIALSKVNRHMPIILIAGGILGLGCLLVPITTTPWIVAAGGFVIMASFPVIDANVRSIYQRKVDPSKLGRVIGLRNFVLGLTQCVMLLAVGPLADSFYEPAMQADGWMAPLLGDIYGTGQGRGIAVLVSSIGALMLVAVCLASLSRNIRRVDVLLPDVEIELDAETADDNCAVMATPEKHQAA